MTGSIVGATQFLRSCTVSVLQLPPDQASASRYHRVIYERSDTATAEVLDHLLLELREHNGFAKEIADGGLVCYNPNDVAADIINAAHYQVLKKAIVSFDSINDRLRSESRTEELAILIEYVECVELWFEHVTRKEQAIERIRPMQWQVSESMSRSRGWRLPRGAMLSLRVKMCRNSSLMFLVDVNEFAGSADQSGLEFAIRNSSSNRQEHLETSSAAAASLNDDSVRIIRATSHRPPCWQPLLPVDAPSFAQWHYFQDPISVSLWWREKVSKVNNDSKAAQAQEGEPQQAVEIDECHREKAIVVSNVNALAASVYPTPPDGIVQAVAEAFEDSAKASPVDLPATSHDEPVTTKLDQPQSSVESSPAMVHDQDDVVTMDKKQTNEFKTCVNLSEITDEDTVPVDIDTVMHDSEHVPSVCDVTNTHKSISAIVTPLLSPATVKSRLLKRDFETMKLDSDLSHRFDSVNFDTSLHLSSEKYKTGKFSRLDHTALSRETQEADHAYKCDDHHVDRIWVSDFVPRSQVADSDDEDSYSAETTSKKDGVTVNESLRRLQAESESGCHTDQDYLPHDRGLQKRAEHSSHTRAASSLPSPDENDDMHDVATASETTTTSKLDLWNLFNLSASDIVEIAHMVTEQYNYCSHLNTATTDIANPDLIEAPLGLKGVHQTFITKQDVHDFANLSKSTMPANKDGKTPRPVPRRIQAGPGSGSGSLPSSHLYALEVPFVRLRRADCEWEMLPTVVEWWEVMTLEPLNQTKNVIASVVALGSKDFCKAAHEYVRILGAKYESCRLGSHRLLTDCKHAHSPDMAHAPGSAIDFMIAILAACMSIHTQLDQHGPSYEESVVLYLIDPFERKSMLPFLCACLWHSTSRNASDTRRLSDRLHLRIIPSSTIAAFARFESPRSTSRDPLAALARLDYDMLPGQRVKASSKTWQMGDSSCFRLVTPVPPKINFAVQASTPINLLQEAQILHVAYRISNDQKWISVAWTDPTGAHQESNQFCLHETEAYTVLDRARNWTRALLTDGVTWRVFVAKLGTMSSDEADAWASLVGTLVAVTLIDVSIPGSVPVRSSALRLSFTDSDQTVHDEEARSDRAAKDECITSDSSMSCASIGFDMTTLNPDTRIIDLADDSWAMITPFSATNVTNAYVPKAALASGLLVKRGNGKGSATSYNDRLLPTLGIDITRDLTPSSLPKTEKSWLTPRSPEGVLREVLTWYRALALLAKLRSLSHAEDGNVPWHIAMAFNGAEALQGFFDDTVDISWVIADKPPPSLLTYES